MVFIVKVVKGLNEDYLIEHSEDIINKNDVLLVPYYFSYLEFSDSFELQNILYRLQKKHEENFNMFRKTSCRQKGETKKEAYTRITHEYCDKTGHWDLFLWEEVPEDLLKEGG